LSADAMQVDYVDISSFYRTEINHVQSFIDFTIQYTELFCVNILTDFLTVGSGTNREILPP